MGKPLPTASEVAEKWSTRASGAQADYVSQVKKATWKTEAVAGEANFKTAMNNVIAKELRKKGIEKVSDTVWQNGVEENAGRYGSGVTSDSGKLAMNTGMTPVMNDIKTGQGQLKARGPKGSAQNFQRSTDIGTFLHNESVKRKG